MSTHNTRGPRQMLENVCENFKLGGRCSRPLGKFTAFRTTARFCSDNCRAEKKRREDRAESPRTKLIEEKNGKCDVCGKADVRMFRRKHPETGEYLLLCGNDQSGLSRAMFYKRVPNPGKGYAKRLFRERQDALALQ